MEIIDLLCEGLDALEDAMQGEIHKLENLRWGEEYDVKEKEETDREIGFLRGKRAGYIQIRKSLKQIRFS